VGPAEVILLYQGSEPKVEPTGNGREILNDLAESLHPSEDFWKGAADEIQAAREDWDV
jgi:hypothetical protein